MLYMATPFCLLIGTHRLLNFKNFHSVMGTGLVIDFFLAGCVFLGFQIVNHGNLLASA